MNLMRFALYGADYRPPAVSVNVDIRPSIRPIPLQCERLACKGKEPGQAKGGFLPDADRFQNLPVKESTQVDAHKARKPGPEIGRLSDLVLAWALASTRAHWVAIASRLTNVSAALVTSDPEFSEDLVTLSNIARYRAIHG